MTGEGSSLRMAEKRLLQPRSCPPVALDDPCLTFRPEVSDPSLGILFSLQTLHDGCKKVGNACDPSGVRVEMGMASDWIFW